MGLGEGREVVAGDVALVQDQREAGRSGLRAAWPEHPLQARTQGDDIWRIALIAAGGEGQTLLLVYHQGQGALAQGSALLLVAATRWEAGPAGGGRKTRDVGGWNKDPKTPLPGGTGPPPRPPRPLWRG